MTANERFFVLLESSKTSQKEFADISGIPTSTISAWKKRNTDIPSSYLSAITAFFSVSVEFLLTGNNDGSGNELTATNLLLEYKSMNEDEQEQFDKQFINIYLKKQTINEFTY